MTSDEIEDVAHAREVRALLRRYGPMCGCQTRRHEEGCRWSLDAATRADLHQRLLADPFPRPMMSLDDELDLIRQVRIDPEYAATTLAWFNEMFGIAA